MNTDKKSIKLNAVLNIVRVIGTIVIPLCVTPYVARVLGVTIMGKINFGNAVVSYFSLLASLGVYSYAVREGTAVRNSWQKMSCFASEIFRLNLFTTVIASILLLFCVRFVSIFSDYSFIILLQAANIVFTTLGVEWIYAIYEDYVYITVRTLVIQLFFMICVFSLVKKLEHLYLYLWINMLSGFLRGVINHFRSRRYCNVNPFRIKINYNHIRPILYIFFSTVASTIYTNIDITMIGVIKDDYQVGIYSMAVKICNVFKQIIFAGIDVTMPRLSYMAKVNREDYDGFLYKTVHIVILLVVPLISGAIIQCKNIIWLFLGEAYRDAEQSLIILLVAILFGVAAYFVMHAMLLPFGMENLLLKATLCGALANLMLNGVMIPVWGIKGAAIATLVSELAVFLVSYCGIRGKVRLQINRKWVGTIIVSNLVMVGFMLIVKSMISHRIAEIIFSVLGGVLVYLTGVIIVGRSIAKIFRKKGKG